MWLSEDLQKRIIESAKSAGVTAETLKRVKASVKTDGVIVCHNTQGWVLGITTARGVKMQWNPHHGKGINVTLTKKWTFDVLGESDGVQYEHFEFARQAGIAFAKNKYGELGQVGKYGDIYVNNRDSGTVYIGGVAVIESN